VEIAMKTRHWIAWAVSLALLAALPTTVWAQTEPTLDQIYQAANAGQVPRAQEMVDQVLRTHPNSAKAHYVKAELAARERDASTAQQELATAERLAPGLPFAKPGAAQALRTQVQHLGSASPSDSSARQMGGPAGPGSERAPASGGLPWGKVAIGAVILFGLLALMRRRTRGMPGGGYASGPVAGGAMPGGPMNSTGYGPGMQPGAGYGQPGYGPGSAPGYGQQPGMGSGLGRGLATGLAVGAGAVAAQEIGRRMFHPDGSQVLPDPSSTGAAWNDAGSMDNVDMGGQDFGISDAGSWDSAGGGGMDAGDVGGGSDWDNNS
jgi:hypothetical protein